MVSERWDGLQAASLALLRQLWLGRRTRLDGVRVLPLDLPAGGAARRGFVDVVIGQSERSLERYWLRQALAGGPPPPREVATEADVLRRVAAREGVIGYVGWDAVRPAPPGGVRVLPVRVGDRTLRPGEDGYPLRQSPASEPPPS